MINHLQGLELLSNQVYDHNLDARLGIDNYHTHHQHEEMVLVLVLVLVLVQVQALVQVQVLVLGLEDQEFDTLPHHNISIANSHDF